MRSPEDQFPNTGFYAILDTGYVDAESWVQKGRELLEGGAAVLQIRAKNRPPQEVLSLAQLIEPFTKSFAVPLIINDHLEVARQIEGAGLHIGQDDISPEVARWELGPDRFIGLSTHSRKQIMGALEWAAILNYFAVGPVFPTGTKPTYTPVGIPLVQFAAQQNPPIPFFCIGGISRNNMHEVIAAGAKGLVAVSDPLLDPDTRQATTAFVERIQLGNA
jgi:thiamine-phosphate pyrophosphorylase